MKKQGGFIRASAGQANRGLSDFDSELHYLYRAIGLCIIAVIPIFFNGFFGANVSFGGTSLIIIAGVVLETIKQIESQMLVRHYTGFLSD